MSSVVASRNTPCPCGSGKRYKECHGAVDVTATWTSVASSDATDAMLVRANALLLANDLDGAEAECRGALALHPRHPEALRLLAHCALDRNQPDIALELALEAAKSIKSTLVPKATQLAIWTDLNFIFNEALVDVDGTLSALRRAEYTAWRSALPRVSNRVAPLVSIVLVVAEGARWAEEAIASVFTQRYRLLEVIVAHSETDPARIEALQSCVRRCPFPSQLLHLPGADEVLLANRGVGVAGGDFVNVLHADHLLAPTRIRTLVEEIVNRNLQWGFSNAAHVDENGAILDDQAAPQVRRWRGLIAGMEESHSIGHAFIHQEFVAVGVSNLFFSLRLFKELGGFRGTTHAYAWDFALRALECEEPGYARSIQYLHRADVPSPSAEELEASQVAIFVPFYSGACDQSRPARNRWAPSLRHWHTYFLKRVFYAGHVLMFSMEQLEQLGATILERRREQVAQALEPGVEIIGFAFGEFGLGESLRLFAHSCVEGGIPFGVKDVALSVASRQGDLSMAPYIDDTLRYQCAMYCVNPDTLKLLQSQIALVRSAGAYRVGYWYWELSRIPREWESSLELVDEIWVATEFVADAIRRATRKPVVKIPPPIYVRMDRQYARAEFGLPDDRFLFLFSFDYNSFSERKNPKGAIAAFKQAFPRHRADVGLIIKSTNGAMQPARQAEIRELMEGDARIVAMDQYLSRDQVFGLQSVVDAYMSLHRAEGLGLGLAESMFLGKPVIGTAYSGNLEFMDRDNSLLVDYELVPIGKGEYLYDHEDFEWANPDIGHAAHLMRKLADDAEFRVRLARRGQEAVRTRFTYMSAAALMRRRLSELGLL